MVIQVDHASTTVQVNLLYSPALLVPGTNLRNSCLVKMLGDKWASHSLYRHEPPHNSRRLFAAYPPGPGLPASTRWISATERRPETSRLHPGCFRTLIAWFPLRRRRRWKSKVQAPTARACDSSHKCPGRNTARSRLATRPAPRSLIGCLLVTQTSPDIPFPSRGWDN